MRKYLCLDTGYCVTQCAALSEDGKNSVLYFTPWATRAGKYAEYSIGKYFPNIEKVYEFEKYLDEGLKEGNCIVNFAVENNGLIGWLRDKYPDASIVGSGNGSILEDDRVKLKKCIEAFGLQTQKYDVVFGLKDLREYIKKNPKRYIKINRFRGDCESFFAKDYDTVKIKLDKLQVVLGPHADDNNPKTAFPFICEESIDSEIEVGCDLFFSGSDYIRPYLYGYEISKGPYIGRIVDELPIALQETMDCFAPLLEKFKWRGPVSTEEKVVSKDENYFLDICSRLPSPLSVAYPHLIKNWAEAIYLIGKGEEVEFDIDYKYVAVCPFRDVDAREDFVRVNIKKGHEKDCSLLMACGDEKGGLYAVKGLEEVGAAIALGNSVDEVIKKLEENAEYIENPGMDKDVIFGIGDKMKEIIAKGEEVGINF